MHNEISSGSRSNGNPRETIFPTIHSAAESQQSPHAEAQDHHSEDTGLACLVAIARFHGIAVDPGQIEHEFKTDDTPLDRTSLLLAARSLGLNARTVKTRMTRLDRIALPAIAVDDENGTFFIIVRLEKEAETVMIHHSGKAELIALSFDTFWQRCQGNLILFASHASMRKTLAKFDFSWFIPALMKYRRLLTEVLVVSFFIQVLALVTPLFFQVVMDKVLVHRGLTTLDVIAVGLCLVMLFDVVLNALRTYVFSHTTSRIDVELGSQLFRHLLMLPVAYFQARRVGDSVARVRELENIRAFLTGNAITLLMDLLFSFVFLSVMLYYSGWLTLIVIVSLPCYVLLSLVCTPVLRRRLDEKFARGAENQAFLVETISGIDTVKSMAAEPHWIRSWENQLAAYIRATFRTATVAIWANGGVNLISKFVTVALMWVGARLVIDNKLTVGQLIAFNMLSGQVSGPIMRLAQLWTDFQQTGISVARLGDILNAPTETQDAKIALPPVTGHIELDDVVFRYRPEGPYVLSGLSLSVRAGEVLGIVGPSGSGKSTLARLVQRLYVPERGRVMVDGHDLALVDAASLRRQIGVVQQENVLFNRSIRDNIALTDPGAPLADVIKAAKQAGAHEFIAELQQGYDTLVGEHGSTLSGGQRQRIAIARALMSHPRILIFDEATSALDYESERMVQDNMHLITQGRTVLVIAHRLSAVRHADRIIVMERGRLIEEGPHERLLAAGGTYARLCSLQTGG
ncbi:type I secretion system permease/ATPase [Paraburkholderia hayleyella]|uniref:type I secretion system permease/ATPase n=1 Tax=Paraburkholderia hayleyella TaxID=2152889 RepID=UPI001290B3CF|nr:type I secretion system permease/ATPase [Paraburkholderia hayleyella]